LYESLIIWLDQ